jgi:hypothetical protein
MRLNRIAPRLGDSHGRLAIVRGRRAGQDGREPGLIRPFLVSNPGYIGP